MAAKDFHHPFEPYEIQQRFMEAVYECIERGQVGIFESPTGTGKSLSLICGSLTWLREHKRKVFDESMQNIQADDDEPKWMLDHARETRRREALQLRSDFEKRLAEIREKERKLREKHANGEPVHKRRKQADPDGDSKGTAEDQFALDDYDSDEASSGKTAESKYSTETTKLLEKLGMILPQQNRAAEEIEEELKIFFCSRTHSQLSQFVGELQRVKLPPDLPPEPAAQTEREDITEAVKQITLGSRKNLCINPKVSKFSSQTVINERCLELQQPSTPSDRRCQYLPKKDNEDLVLDFRDHALAAIRDIEDLADVGKKLGVCPYYASRSAVTPAEMVTLPYPLLLQKTAREALRISLRGHVVIIDEAHNLMDAVEGTYSAQVSETRLRLARESLMVYLQRFRNKLKGSNRVYVTQVVRVLDSLLQFVASVQGEKMSGGTIEPGSLLAGKGVDQINLSKLVRYITESKLARKVEGYMIHVKQADAKADKKSASVPQTPETPTLTLVANFFMTLMNPSKEGQFFWAREDNTMVIRYMLLDPSEHFRDIVEDARAVVLAGGTMSPMDDYTQQLFPYLSSVCTLSCGHIIPPSNLLIRPVALDDTGPLAFNFKSRSTSAMSRRLGNALLAVLPRITGGTVIFFSSYSYLEQVRRQWQNDGTESRISSVKPVFFDSRANPAEQTFTGYSAAIASNPGGATLFSVIGGNLSEGINFSDALGRCVIVVGLPFPNLETPEWKAKMAYLDSRAVARGEPNGKASRDHAENVCMRAVNQAIGRAIRHKGDWASILLLDERYMEMRVQAKLPGWIRGSLPQDAAGSGRVREVVEDVAGFFRGKQQS